jgi:hypothetical protein
MNAGEQSLSTRDVLDEVREAYLTAYPNPYKLGCPSPQLIKDLAAKRFRPEPGSDIVQHLTRCSECYRDYESKRGNRSRHVRSAVTRLAGLTLVVFATGLLALHLGKKS